MKKYFFLRCTHILYIWQRQPVLHSAALYFRGSHSGWIQIENLLSFQILQTVLTSCVKMLSLHQLGLYFTQTSSARLPCDSLTGHLNKNNYTFQNNLSDRGVGTHSVLTTCPASTGCFFSVLQIIVPRWIWIKSPLCSVGPR